MIPKSFQIGGVTWKVNHKGNIESVPGTFEFGECDFTNTTIKVAKVNNNVPIQKEIMEETFYHELMHCILGTMSHDLWSNEQFVQTLAAFLYQYEKTKKC